MKIYFSTLILLLSLVVACKKNIEKEESPVVQVVFDELEKNPANGFMLYQGVLFTGVAKEYMKDGKTLKYLVTYSEGLKNGISKRWYDNGNKNYETQYVNGRKQGLTKIWFRSGELQSEATYFKGVVHGIETIWYSTGEKQKERILHYGQEKGMQKAWRKNGKLYANYEAVNGRIFGLLGSNMCYEVENEIVKK
ncbi:toxin-antitoxin system YwqK family antitoxin [Wenyingzhuangia sp. 1_MG-2023]|nr:toxin-antitoxin system YwqK family antitoxin [Wenyingzhuangia sp. 1_MG-2023]